MEIFDDMDPEEFVKYVKNVRDHIIEIPLTKRFNKKLNDLMKKKKDEKEDRIYINELLELSREASLEDEAQAKKKNHTRKLSR